jgi:hypothetical protein
LNRFGGIGDGWGRAELRAINSALLRRRVFVRDRRDSCARTDDAHGKSGMCHANVIHRFNDVVQELPPRFESRRRMPAMRAGCFAER